jgi:hypothetical protein
LNLHDLSNAFSPKDLPSSSSLSTTVFPFHNIVFAIILFQTSARMPPADPGGVLHTEKGLDINAIADIQEIRNGTADIVFEEEHEYLGVLLVSITRNPHRNNGPKRQRLETRAVILGQSQTEHGKVALIRRPGAICQTVVGPEMKQDGGSKAGIIHWCSGLQIKWVPSITKSTQNETGLFKEKLVQDARLDLVKNLLALLEEADKWSDIDWEEVDVCEAELFTFTCANIL